MSDLAEGVVRMTVTGSFSWRVDPTIVAAIIALAPLAACGKGDDSAGPSDPDVTDPSPYVVPDPDPITPSLTTPEIESAMNDAVARLVGLEPSPVLDAYVSAMAGADGACPAYYTDGGGNTYWYAYCTASSGAAFNGYGYYYPYHDLTDEYGTWNGAALYAAMAIDTPEGYRFDGNGSASLVYGWDTWGSFAVQAYTSGSFGWDGPADPESWLAEGLSPEVGLWSEYYPAGKTRPEAGLSYSVDGGLTGIGADIDTAAFTSFGIASASLGWPCDGEPTGTISIRDNQGEWYDVVFDVNGETWTVDPARCDGCGDVWFRGESIGQACVDVSPLWAWDGSAP